MKRVPSKRSEEAPQQAAFLKKSLLELFNVYTVLLLFKTPFGLNRSTINLRIASFRVKGISFSIQYHYTIAYPVVRMKRARSMVRSAVYVYATS